MLGPIVLVLLVGAALPAAARSEVEAEHPRVQTQSYETTYGARTYHDPDPYLGLAPEPEPMVFHPRPGDRSVRLDIDDASGRNVIAFASQGDVEEDMCTVSGSLPVTGREPLLVRVYSGACANHNWGFTSTGTITATFSRKVVPGGQPEHEHP